MPRSRRWADAREDAANVARGLRSAGHAVMLVGRLGDDDIGIRLRDELIAWDVGTEYLERCGASGRALVFIDASGERTIFPIVQHSRADDEGTTPDAVLHAALSTASCVYLDEYETLPDELPTVLDDSAAFIVTGAPTSGSALWPANLVIASARHFPAAWLDAPLRACSGRRRCPPGLGRADAWGGGSGRVRCRGDGSVPGASARAG